MIVDSSASSANAAFNDISCQTQRSQRTRRDCGLEFSCDLLANLIPPEFRFSFLQESRNALAKIMGGRGNLLQLHFQVELAVKII